MGLDVPKQMHPVSCLRDTEYRDFIKRKRTNSRIGSITVLVSYCCYNKLSQTWWLKIMHICSFIVLKVRSLKSKCWQGYFPSGSFRGEFISFSFQLQRPRAIPWLIAPSFYHSNLLLLATHLLLLTSTFLLL